MSLRLGFCGVGRWARKLAESFRACGAEIVAYDRKNRTITGDTSYGGPKGEVPRFERLFGGSARYTPWRDQITDKNIDAIIAVAPPEITTEIALACIETGKPCMATKPLLRHAETTRSVFYVDFFRLWSGAHAAAKASGAAVSLVLKGSGPVRDFPGMFDYGPHVVAAMLDIAGGRSIRLVDQYHEPGENDGVYMAQWLIGGELISGGTLVDANFGNGAPVGARSVSIHLPDGTRRTDDETPTHIGTELKDEVIQKMCRSFIADVQEGFVDTRLLNLSREGMRLLKEIREEAK